MVDVDEYSFFLNGYCSTVQGLLDWFEVDLGFTELLFIQVDLCVLCVFVLYSRVSLSSCPLLDILHMVDEHSLKTKITVDSPACKILFSSRLYGCAHVCVCVCVFMCTSHFLYIRTRRKGQTKSTLPSAGCKGRFRS